MDVRPGTIRMMFGGGGLLTAVALGMHISNWKREGTVHWPVAISMVGGLLVAGAGAADIPWRLRLALTGVALAMLVIGLFGLLR